GPVDVLVNNAGLSQRSLALDTDLEVDRRLMTINYLGTVALTKAALPAMIERRAGQVVVVTSLVGKIGSPLRSGYAASKHALHGFFESLRAELHGSGVGVTMVLPGYIRTELPMHALVGDGSAQGRMDRAQLEGMAAERCARKIARAIARRRAEVVIGGREVAGVYVHRLFPALFRWLLPRVRVT
ncbi:MAG TPA: SDR family NAD(P)-dependent oxidoreductase, partial [Nannocystaceae bacterium]|nr:SDR family NAD(P)-dependent oxidoreductase [Nannocystaceae bacterium]